MASPTSSVFIHNKAYQIKTVRFCPKEEYKGKRFIKEIYDLTLQANVFPAEHFLTIAESVFPAEHLLTTAVSVFQCIRISGRWRRG